MSRFRIIIDQIEKIPLGAAGFMIKNVHMLFVLLVGQKYVKNNELFYKQAAASGRQTSTCVNGPDVEG